VGFDGSPDRINRGRSGSVKINLRTEGRLAGLLQEDLFQATYVEPPGGIMIDFELLFLGVGALSLDPQVGIVNVDVGNSLAGGAGTVAGGIDGHIRG